VPPAAGVLGHWSLLLFPEEMGRRSKTHQLNDSILLDDPKALFLKPVWTVMHRRGDESPVWSFQYPAFVTRLKEAVAALRAPQAAPYQMGHPGPPIDFADSARTTASAQRRGRWAQPRSMLRCERSARLAAEWRKLPATTRAACEGSAARVEAAILRQNVTSKGGTTAAALSVLMADEGLADLMKQALKAAHQRSIELGQ